MHGGGGSNNDTTIKLVGLHQCCEKNIQNEMFHSATTLGVAGHDGTDGSVTILGMEGKMITATMM